MSILHLPWHDPGKLLLYVLLEKGIDDAFYKAHIGIATTGDVVLSPLIMANIAVISASLAAVLAFTLLRSWRINKRFHWTFRQRGKMPFRYY